jgi:hypothetical protein
MFIFSIRTVVLALAVSASSLSGAATLSEQSELLCSPEGLMRVERGFRVTGPTKSRRVAGDGKSVLRHTRRAQIISLAAQKRLPAFYRFREFAVAGGLISYGQRITDGYHSRSVCWLGLWELPLAAQDIGARTIKPRRVVPAIHDRQAVWNLSIAAAELNGDRAVCILF